MISFMVLAFVALSFNASAQSPTDDLFEKYGAKDGFTTVHITKELFSLFAEIADESDESDVQDLNSVIKGLDHIRILMCDSDENKDPEVMADFKEHLDQLKLKNFTELMTVKEGNDLVKFMIMKDGKKIKELLLLINQPDEAGFISITGDIDLKSIAKISKSMNIEGLENLQKLDQDNE